MSSRPGLFIYGNDLYTDTAQCSDSTVGIWTLLLILMNKRGTGKLVDSARSLILATRTNRRNWNRAIEELRRHGIAEIHDVAGCDLVSIRSARMEKMLAEYAASTEERNETRKNRFKSGSKNATKNAHDSSASTNGYEHNQDELEDNVTPSRAHPLEARARVKKEGSLEGKTSGKQEEGSPREDDAGPSVQEVVDSWNDFAAPLGLATVRKPTKARRAGIRTRWREVWPAIDQLYAEIRGSPFLLGEKNDWKVTFDFIWCRQDGWVRILEGQYRKGRNGKPKRQTPSAEGHLRRIAVLTGNTAAQASGEVGRTG